LWMQLDSDWENDDVLADDDDEAGDDAGPWSTASSAFYSNTLFSIDEEDLNSSSVADNGGLTPSAKSVHWPVNDVQLDADDVQVDVDDQQRPVVVSVITRHSKPTIFEKKYLGMLQNECCAFV